MSQWRIMRQQWPSGTNITSSSSRREIGSAGNISYGKWACSGTVILECITAQSVIALCVTVRSLTSHRSPLTHEWPRLKRGLQYFCRHWAVFQYIITRHRFKCTGYLAPNDVQRPFELVRIWKVSNVPCSNTLTWYLFGVSEENKENPSKDSP
jgi:hypothetical protein